MSLADANQAQAAVNLLRRSFNADTTLRYSANVQIAAMYGEHKMQTRAHLMRAPRRLTVTYLSGDRRGLEGGFNERWFWRREDKDAPIQAYAEVAYRPEEMAAQRFALMTRNYRGRILRRENIGDSVCDVVEIRRTQPLQNARGPFKRLWLDRQSGLTLRSDAYNYRGDLVQRSVLSNLQLAPAVQSFVQPAQMKAVALKTSWKNEELGANRAKVVAMTNLAPPQPTWLPAGFTFDSVGMQRTSLSKDAPVAALSRYGDGMNVITIFSFKTPAKKAESKTAERVSCTFGAGAMAMRETPGGLTLLAIGDLPTETLNRVLDSVPAT